MRSTWFLDIGNKNVVTESFLISITCWYILAKHNRNFHLILHFYEKRVILRLKKYRPIPRSVQKPIFEKNPNQPYIYAAKSARGYNPRVIIHTHTHI